MKQFADVEIQCWEHEADSRFGVKRPYICLQAGSKASEIVLILLDELSGLRPPAQRVMTLVPSQRPKACSKIRFIVSEVSDELTEMSLTLQAEVAEFEFTLSGLKRFREAVELLRSGQEDFCVRPSERSSGVKDHHSGEVWFWTPFMDP